ncbi:MAG: ABC transporter substrate-binding protein [Proteobacteria bacterium]|nr:ABC transporter substrate-binding protein [Pseudomonadota bacterium]MBU1060577.1 ABC transporter substrate-binding protein [Pseudomonadota bacterium]
MKGRIPAILVVLAIIVVTLGYFLFRENDPNSATRHERLGKKEIETLAVGFAGLGDLNTLDPARSTTTIPIFFSWIMYDRLVDVTSEGKVVPMLASSWRSTEDFKEWRFQIRTDISFNGTGKKMEARDVASSIERALRTPGLGPSLLSDLVEGATEALENKSSIPGISVEKNEVVFRLTRPFAMLPERLAAPCFGVVLTDKENESDGSLFGTGPYSLVNWDRSRQTVILKKEKYWGDTTVAAPQVLDIRIFTAEAPAVEELRAGTLDWLETTSSALPLVGKQPPKGLRVDAPPSTEIRLVALNMEQPPFSSTPGIGHALNLATDRMALIKALGGGQVISSPVPSRLATVTECALDFDQEHSKIELSKIGPLPKFEMIVQPGESNRTIAELLRSQWASVGVEVTLKPGLADFFDRVIKGNYEMALGYFGPLVPTVEQYLWPYRSSAQPVPNVMRYSSTVFDKKLREYTGSGEAGDRKLAIQKALAVVCTDSPAVWLFRPSWTAVVRDSLQVPRTSAALPLFHRLTIKEN